MTMYELMPNTEVDTKVDTDVNAGVNADDTKSIHVAVAVISDQQGRILIAKRPDHLHQGGLWEFPGGKVEPGEQLDAALEREIHEELGINVRQSRPLIKIKHEYSDRQVLLDVWCVTGFDGQAHGREGQEIKWVTPQQLCDYQFPEANKRIVSMVQLPSLYLITPSVIADQQQFLQKLDTALQAGIKLLQFRQKQQPDTHGHEFLDACYQCCKKYDAKLLVNAGIENLKNLPGDGVHLSGDRLMALEPGLNKNGKLLSASCHNQQELEQAEKMGVDFVMLSPVLDTPSHPGAATLGWEDFSRLVRGVSIPVYALGGMYAEHVPIAYEHGAQGVAVISSIWNASDISQAVKNFGVRVSVASD